MLMLGFGWFAVRQAGEALQRGRLEEARRLLCQPAAQGHRKSWELLQQVAQGFVDRGEEYLENGDTANAWNDLVAAEQTGVQSDSATIQLRQELTKRGLAEIREQMDAAEPARAMEIIGQLRHRSVKEAELKGLEDAAKSWVQAREQAARGEFAQALQTIERARKQVPGQLDALEQFVAGLEQKLQKFADCLVYLHDAVRHRDWREVVRISEQALAMAPQHLEAKKAQAMAWKTIQPETVASSPRLRETSEYPAAKPNERFLLWIDGVGGFLVCLGTKVTLGQATQDTYVDIPLFADVSRLHASLTRDTEGYLLEATRSMLVNGTESERVLLQSGDRITLGGSCQLQFRQPVPVSTSARLDLVSGHRLPLTVDGVLLMADTLVMGPGTQVHVSMPDIMESIVLYRHREGLGVRCTGNFSVNGERCHERGVLPAHATVTGDDFSFAIEPVGATIGRV